MSRPRLSVIIPAHNERERLHLAMQGISGEVAPRLNSPEELEVVVISDGSTDGTPDLARQLMQAHGLHGRVIELDPCRGKGGALAEGFRVAEGDYCFFTDADLATPAETIWRMLPILERGDADLVIGSRRLPDSRVIHPQGAMRQFLGHIFTRLSNIILGTTVTDFTCGFKGYSSRAGREIFSRLSIFRWAYDAEAIFIAKVLGFSVAEVGVTWADVEGSKVRTGRAVLESLWDLLNIRWNGARGRYGP